MTTREEAIQLIERRKTEFEVFADKLSHMLPGGDGIDVVRALMSTSPDRIRAIGEMLDRLNTEFPQNREERVPQTMGDPRHPFSTYEPGQLALVITGLAQHENIGNMDLAFNQIVQAKELVGRLDIGQINYAIELANRGGTPSSTMLASDAATPVGSSNQKGDEPPQKPGFGK